MKKFKYVVVFISGLTVGMGVSGYKVLSCVLKHKNIRDAVMDTVSDKILGFVFYENEGYKFPTYDTAEDANKVLARIFDFFDTYGMMSVADLYEITGVGCGVYEDTTRGWCSKNAFGVYKIDKGFIIRYSRPMPLYRR